MPEFFSALSSHPRGQLPGEVLTGPPAMED